MNRNLKDEDYNLPWSVFWNLSNFIFNCSKRLNFIFENIVDIGKVSTHHRASNMEHGDGHAYDDGDGQKGRWKGRQDDGLKG
jgi:hypothetical protein